MNYLAIGSVLLVVVGTILGYYATTKSDRQVKEVQTELNNVKGYSVYATMNIFGDDRMIFAGPGISITSHSDLHDRMVKVVTLREETGWVTTDLTLLPIIDTVIEKYPNFPFGYYVKAILLRSNQKPEWRIPANKAIEIFKITTSIKGHAQSQDDAMHQLDSLLNTAFP